MKGGWVSTITLWLLAPLLLWLSASRPHDVSVGRADRLPREAGSLVAREDYEITPSMRALLGTDDAIWRRYGRSGDESGTKDVPVFVVGVFHSANWKALHPPHTCLLGSNMEMVTGDVVEAGLESGEAFEYGRLRMRSLGPGRSGYLSLYVYLAPPDLVTGVYRTFVLHQAPRAILRQDVAGGLLRVETWAPGDDFDAAEARCREVLDALLPAAQELLR